MVKAVYTILGCLFISHSIYAAPTTLDCQSSTNNFESNLSELEKVAVEVDDCPAPTKEQIMGICNSVYDKQEGSTESGLSYQYQEGLWDLSCAKPKIDSPDIARQKIQKMWNKNRENFRCYKYPNVTVTDGSILKFAMDTNFSTFLVSAVRKYNLDMNFKDPKDGKTIMDFLQDRITTFKKGNFPDQVAEYERIYKLLSDNGAKHGKDL